MASEKNARGHCERCGWEYPLAKLVTESQPDKQDIRVCKTCFDPYNIRNDPMAVDSDEDTSLEDPVYDVERFSLFAWNPVGNVTPVRTSVLYRWL